MSEIASLVLINQPLEPSPFNPGRGAEVVEGKLYYRGTQPCALFIFDLVTLPLGFHRRNGKIYRRVDVQKRYDGMMV